MSHVKVSGLLKRAMSEARNLEHFFAHTKGCATCSKCLMGHTAQYCPEGERRWRLTETRREKRARHRR